MLSRLRARLPAGTLVLAAISIANLMLGLAREATIAFYFGTSTELDTFLVALALPKLLVVNMASISVAVVLPIYVGYRQAGRHSDATALVQKWFWFSATSIAVVCAALFVGADILTHFIAPGFDAAQRSRAANWLRMLLPYVWLLGMVGVFTVVLNSHDRFAVPASSPILVSVAVVAACAIGARSFGVGVLAAGFVAGGCLAFVWHLVGARRLEPRLPSLRRPAQEIALPLAAGGAMVLHSVARQIDVIVDRAFASGLPDGSIAAYNYAVTVNAIPSAIMTAVIATALYPVIARMAAGLDWQGALRTVFRWSGILVALGLGPVLFLLIFRAQVMSILFERGAFDETGVRMSADVMVALPFLILVSAVSTLFTQLLLVQGRARVVAGIAVLAILVKIAINLALVPRLGLLGLALATLIAGFSAACVRVILAWKYNPTSPNEVRASRRTEVLK